MPRVLAYQALIPPVLDILDALLEQLFHFANAESSVRLLQFRIREVDTSLTLISMLP